MDLGPTSDQANAISDHPRVWIFPPFIPLSTLVLGVGLQFIFPLSRFFGWLPSFVHYAIAPLLFACGLVVMICGKTALLRAKTNVDPRQPALCLVETWPYTISRNPMYLGGSVGLVALSLGFSLYWILVLLLISLPILHFGVVRKEERYLEQKFCRAYLEYTRRVRRWL